MTGNILSTGITRFKFHLLLLVCLSCSKEENEIFIQPPDSIDYIIKTYQRTIGVSKKTIISTIQYYYNQYSQVVKKTERENGSDSYLETLITYDKNGKKSSEITHDNLGYLEYGRSFKYNKNGQ